MFEANGCGGCHTLAAAGATATVGPDLDKLSDYAQKAGKPLKDFIRESIVEPDAYVEAGFPKSVMPPFSALPKDQLDALVQYLAESSKGAEVTATTFDQHHVPSAPAPRKTMRDYVLKAGWIRAAWMTALLWGIGLGIVLVFRWWGGWDPLFKWDVITVVATLTAAPIGFLAGLGAFDYWVRYAIGSPDRGRRTTPATARKTWRDYFRLNTDHKVIGIQYLVTTIVFFVIGGMLAMLFRAELARPGMQFVDHADLQRPGPSATRR